MKKHTQFLAIAMLFITNIAYSQTTWDLLGNTGTSSTTNFVGTTDLNGLTLRTNNQPRMFLNSGGFIGINNNNPIGRLDIVGLHSFSGLIVNSPPCLTFPCLSDFPVFVVQEVDAFNNPVNPLFFVEHKGNVGVGTNSPGYKLTVAGGDIALDTDFKIRSNQFASDYIEFKQAQFSFVSRGKTMLFLCELFGNIPDVINIGDGTDINTTIYANNNNTAITVNGGTGNVGIGTAPGLTYKLVVEGILGAREIKVNLISPWPDYVFNKNYKLMPLDSVKKFTLKNKHLPGMPSADDLVKDGGLSVGKMQTLQQEKIEDIYLYLFQFGNKITALEAENALLKQQIILLQQK